MLLLYTINYNDRNNEIVKEIFKNFHEILVEEKYPISTTTCTEEEQNKLILFVTFDFLVLLKETLLISIKKERKKGKNNEEIEIDEKEEDEVVDVFSDDSDGNQSSYDSVENQYCDAINENKDKGEVNSYSPENNDIYKGKKLLMNLTKVTVTRKDEPSTITKKYLHVIWVRVIM